MCLIVFQLFRFYCSIDLMNTISEIWLYLPFHGWFWIANGISFAHFLHSENGKYNPISVWFNKNRKIFPDWKNSSDQAVVFLRLASLGASIEGPPETLLQHHVNMVPRVSRGTFIVPSVDSRGKFYFSVSFLIQKISSFKSSTFFIFQKNIKHFHHSKVQHFSSLKKKSSLKKC